MEERKATLGIYGIQDRMVCTYPQYVHDHGLALMDNGEVLKFLQLERYTRTKRDNNLHKYITDIVRNGELANRNLDLIFVDNVVGRAFISADGQIRFEAPLINRLGREWEKGRSWWFDREQDAYVISHELAHVFSCVPFYGFFNENSLLVHFDGGASFSNFSAWIYRNGKIIPVEHHWELKYLTSLFNANALAFGIIGADICDQNSVPGKLMGYAALGNYNEDIEFWLRQNNWFSDIWGKRSQFFEMVKSDFQIDLKSFDQRNGFLQDVAATIQDVFMRDLLLKLDDVNTLSGCKYLYYSGGCALNIHANSAIVESGLFEQVFIPPCADDSGLSLGAAAFGEWKKGSEFKPCSPFLNDWGIEQPTPEYSYEDIKQIAQILVEGKVVAVCNGFGEAGPRALGNRSLLALPTKALAHKVSVVLKNREWYRPVAPVMLEKNSKYYTGKTVIDPLSKFMLLDLPVLVDKMDEIAGVVHANGTSRIQTLFTRSNNPFLFDLLSLLDAQYNIKALINTSLNAAGEPMVHTNEDALQSATKMGVDALVLNGRVQMLHVL
jgi:carbamoyltransferase